MAEVVNVVLFGFMGAGKTSVARRLAEHHGFQAIDTDVLVEELAGKSVADVFADDGEAAFRAFERQAVRLVADRPGLAVATGGGVVVDEGNMALLALRGLGFLLDAPFELLLDRIGRQKGTRPLAVDERILRDIFETRRPAYERVAQVVTTAGRSVDEVADEVVERYRAAGGVAPPGSSW